jgi:septal ring factor EnvC (AmiA/AmiB activator)
MSCFGQNYNPEPTREWSRYENPCAYSNNPLVLYNGIAYKLDVLKKGNVLQYKKNSSNITKQQRYAQIARGLWTNRTTTWATQTQSYTNPNTNSLKRSNFQNYNTATLAPTSAPITCPAPIIPINFVLPYVNGGSDSAGANPAPVIPPQQRPPLISPANPVIPPIIPIAEPEPVIIPDGGSLICNVSENICTGQIYGITENQFCYPTSDSDVPGPIIYLCYNDGLPTYYPRTRRVFAAGGNKWPQGEKFIKSAIETFNLPQSFSLAVSSVGNAVQDKNYGNSGVYGNYGTRIINSDDLTNQYNNLEKLITDKSSEIIANQEDIANKILYTTGAITSTQGDIKSKISDLSSDLAKSGELLQNSVSNAVTSIKSQAIVIKDLISSNIDNVNTNVNAVNANVDNINTKVNAVNANVDNVNTKVNAVNANVDNVNTNVNAVNANVEDAANKILYSTGAITSTQGDIKSKISNLSTDVAKNGRVIQNSVSNAVTSINSQAIVIKDLISSNIDKVDTNVNAVNANVDAVNANVDAVNNRVGSLVNVFGEFNKKTVSQLNEFVAFAEDNGPLMRPFENDTTDNNSIQSFKDYLDAQFLFNASKIDALQSELSNAKTAISEKIDTTKLDITDLINTTKAEIVAGNTLINEKINASKSDFTDLINTTNAEIVAGNALISEKIDTTKSDITDLIDTTNAEIVASNTLISEKINASKSDITDLINTTKAQIDTSHATISGKIDTSKSDIADLINTTKAEIVAGNTFISEKMDTIKADITGLINTTKAQLETIIQSVVTSNSQIFVLLSAVAANGTGGNGNGNGGGTIQETMIHTLLISETFSTIMTYYSDLADGNFEALSAELTGEKFTQLSKELFDFKSGLAINSDYETIRRIIVTSFEALMRMVTTNIAYLELQNNYEVVFNRSKILDNIELLKEYIDSLNNSGNLSIVPEISIVAPFIELRPEIQAYIDKYGLPEDGVFNPDKLAELL